MKMDKEEKRAKNAEKSRKRRAELEEAAVLNGFDNWSAMLTYIKNEAKEGRKVILKPRLVEHDGNHHFAQPTITEPIQA
jgi:hypothetical protein